MKKKNVTNLFNKKEWGKNKTIRLQTLKKSNKIESMPNEIWKTIDGYDGMYEVSNFGRIKSLCRFKSKKNRWGGISNYLYEEKLLSIPKSNGAKTYPQVCLFNGQVKKYVLLHRIIALVFIPNPENKPEVNHKDGNKFNYSISNLEWVTRKENVNHALDIKLIIREKGEKCPITKLKDLDVCKIREYYSTGMYYHKDLAKIFNVSSAHICNIINNKSRVI